MRYLQSGGALKNYYVCMGGFLFFFLFMSVAKEFSK